jgi:arsenate reductase
MPVKRVVFACVHNAGRSQMAAAWFNRLADPVKASAISAGTQPAEHVHPVVVEAMKERDIDLSKAKPQRLTTELARDAAFLVTMGCGESCPYIPGVPILDWPLPDPRGQGIESVRVIRDEVETRVRAFVKQQAWDQAASAQVR